MDRDCFVVLPGKDFRGNDGFLGIKGGICGISHECCEGGRVGIDKKMGEGRSWIPAFAGMTMNFDGNGIKAWDRDCFVATLLAMTGWGGLMF